MTASPDLEPANRPLHPTRDDDPLTRAEAMRAATLRQNRWGLIAYAVMLLAVGLLAAIVGGEYDLARMGNGRT